LLREWKRSIRSQCSDGENGTTGKSAKDQLQLLSPTPDDLVGIYSTPSSSPILSANGLLGGGIVRNRHLSDASNVGSDNDVEEGRLVAKAVSRRCLFNMVALLNLSYPDYDFLETKSDSFTSCTLEVVTGLVSASHWAQLCNVKGLRSEREWQVLHDCE
jgi:Maf1 regulator